jgi:hypothetical protein
LAQPQSGRQGTVAVNLDAAAQTAGTGTLTLEFQPLAKGATDPAIQLGVVGRSLPFDVSVGDQSGHFPGLDAVAFQTGTTAGTLVFTATLAGATDRKSVNIPAAPVAVLSASGMRGAASIELDVTGYDNTRTAGAVTYTFYDPAGNAIVSAMTVDYTNDFAAWFSGSNQGGNFLLRSVFPIAGDASRIVAFEVQIANSAGTATTGRVKF